MEENKYNDWLNNAKGRLALIVFADQMTRNIYRGTPKAWQYDSLAQKWCKDGIHENLKHDKVLFSMHPVYCWIYYSPLLHSEDIKDHELNISKWEEMMNQLKTEDPNNPNIKSLEMAYDFTKHHKSIIDRVGRFPQRNKYLNRESTQAEIDLIKEMNLESLVHRNQDDENK